MHFKDRSEAGQLLAQALKQYQNQPVVVYAIPRGGVVTAIEIARVLHAPLDLIITRKIGHPYQPEYAIAAVAEDGHMLGSKEELQAVDKNWLAQEVESQRREAKRRREHYLKNRPEISAQGKIAILVDDGIATGTTMRLGIQELKHRQCKKIIVAVPVAPKSTADLIKKEADEIVALDIPQDFNYLGAVGAYYGDFAQVEDEEVIALLDQYAKEFASF
jgi:putative phosphoribosyl transferase